MWQIHCSYKWSEYNFFMLFVFYSFDFLWFYGSKTYIFNPIFKEDHYVVSHCKNTVKKNHKYFYSIWKLIAKKVAIVHSKWELFKNIFISSTDVPLLNFLYQKLPMNSSVFMLFIFYSFVFLQFSRFSILCPQNYVEFHCSNFKTKKKNHISSPLFIQFMC